LININPRSWLIKTGESASGEINDKRGRSGVDMGKLLGA
jgi:hypothetical protein